MSNGTDTMDSERKVPKGNMGHTKGIGDPYGMKIKKWAQSKHIRSFSHHTMEFELLKDL